MFAQALPLRTSVQIDHQHCASSNCPTNDFAWSTTPRHWSGCTCRSLPLCGSPANGSSSARTKATSVTVCGACPHRCRHLHRYRHSIGDRDAVLHRAPAPVIPGRDKRLIPIGARAGDGDHAHALAEVTPEPAGEHAIGIFPTKGAKQVLNSGPTVRGTSAKVRFRAGAVLGGGTCDEDDPNVWSGRA